MSNGQLTQFPPGVPDLAWVDDVSALVQSRNGSDQGFILPPLPGLTGACSAFLPNPAVAAYANGVIRLKQFTKPVVRGYLYGGIYSVVAQTSDDPTVAATQTGASNQVFLVTLTPTQS